MTVRLMSKVDLIRVSPDEWERVARLLLSRGYRRKARVGSSKFIYSPDGLTCVSDWDATDKGGSAVKSHYLDTCVLDHVTLEELIGERLLDTTTP